MTFIGWLLVVITHRGMVVLPAQFPNEAICIATARAAYVESYDPKSGRRGLDQFICIPGHSPLYGGTKEN